MGPIEGFIRHMERRSNEAETHGARMTYLGLMDIGMQHQEIHGEENVGGLVNYLTNLVDDPNLAQHHRVIVKLHALNLRESLTT